MRLQWRTTADSVSHGIAASAWEVGKLRFKLDPVNPFRGRPTEYVFGRADRQEELVDISQALSYSTVCTVMTCTR